MVYLRIAWRSLILISHVLLGCLLTLLLRRRNSLGKKHVRPQVVTWWHRHLIRIMGFKVTVTGTLPPVPAFLIANHVSWVDIPLLGSLVSIHFLAKDDVRQWPVIGWLAASAGSVFIKRGGGQTQGIISIVNQQLNQGYRLGVFPEGTTTDGRNVKPFFPRLFAAVVNTDTLIAPIAIRYHIDGEYDSVAPFIGDQSLVDSIVSLLGRKTNQVHVHFAEPIQHQTEDRKALAKKTQDAIMHSLDTMSMHGQLDHKSI